MKGSCLCGAVTYEARGKVGRPRRLPLHPVAASNRAMSGPRPISRTARSTSRGEVRWFRSSDKARRGFCPTCGSALFWTHDDDPFTCFSTGSIDGPTGLRLRGHIHTAAKGDYYDIAGTEPQRED